MVHYIRLLKPPKHNPNPRTPTITTLLTITTDLGDSFLATDASLTAILLSCNVENGDILIQKPLSWIAGSRELSVSLPIPRDVHLQLQSGEIEGVKLVISKSGSESGTRDGLVPRIISAWSAPFGGARGSDAEKIVQRRIRGRKGEEGGEVRVWEEMGNSIALHVWLVPLITF